MASLSRTWWKKTTSMSTFGQMDKLAVAEHSFKREHHIYIPKKPNTTTKHHYLVHTIRQATEIHFHPKTNRDGGLVSFSPETAENRPPPSWLQIAFFRAKNSMNISLQVHMHPCTLLSLSALQQPYPSFL